LHGAMIPEKKYPMIALGAFLALLTSVHILIFQKLSPRVVLEELYYIPILFGALRFGLKGALLTYLFASFSYLPFFFGLWSVTLWDLIDRALHLLFSALFAFLAGYLVDRDRKMRKQAELDLSLRNIGQAASAIVHDLKNPLITILGYARRIREQKGNPVEAARTIFESAENMQKIVSDVLDFSRPVQLELGEKDARELFDQVIDSCKTKAEQAGVTISKNIPEKPMRIKVDALQLQRALVNLINNAIEASGRGQDVVIAMTTRKSRLAIMIKDQGPGMDGETLENIFVPFYTKKAGGTGLGMAIVKKIIDGHKGNIRIESYQGKGTTVTIDLPYNASMGGKKEQ
jgi:signal transduction histidine kinase